MSLLPVDSNDCPGSQATPHRRPGAQVIDFACLSRPTPGTGRRIRLPWRPADITDANLGKCVYTPGSRKAEQSIPAQGGEDDVEPSESDPSGKRCCSSVCQRAP